MMKEKKIVSLSMIILFFSFLVVYSVFYQVKGEKIIRELESSIDINQKLNQLENVSLPSVDIVLSEDDGNVPESQQMGVIDSNILTTGFDAIHVVPDDVEDASLLQNLKPQGENPKILSGADMFFGVVESIELLGLSPDYVLKDKKNIYYAYFTKEPKNLQKTLKDLSGNIYTLRSEQEIISNELFGDKVSFLNIPEYKNKLVIMFISLDKQYRIIQIEYNKYHHIKGYLKSLFID